MTSRCSVKLHLPGSAFSSCTTVYQTRNPFAARVVAQINQALDGSYLCPARPFRAMVRCTQVQHLKFAWMMRARGVADLAFLPSCPRRQNLALKQIAAGRV